MSMKELFETEMIRISKQQYAELTARADENRQFREKFREVLSENDQLKTELNELRKQTSVNDNGKRIVSREQFGCILNESAVLRDMRQSREMMFLMEEENLVSFLRNMPMNFDSHLHFRYYFRRIYPAGIKIVCPKCSKRLKVFAERPMTLLEVTWEYAALYDYIFARVRCRKCGYTRRRFPDSLISGPFHLPGSVISAETAVRFMKEKYVKRKSLFEQEKMLLSAGVPLSAFTLARWLENTARKYFGRLFGELRQELIASRMIHADVYELPGYVHTSEGVCASPTKSSFLWVYHTGRNAKRKIVLLNVTDDDSNCHPAAFLKGFSGVIQTTHIRSFAPCGDNVRAAACWRYVQQLFENALTHIPLSQQENSYAGRGRQLCLQLASLEEECCTEDDHEKLLVRKSKGTSVTEQLFSLAGEFQKETDNSWKYAYTGAAMDYLLTYQEELRQYLCDAEIAFGNDFCDDEAACFSSDREDGWKLVRTKSGMTSALEVYSILRTLQLYCLNPERYLIYYLKNAGKAERDNCYEPLMPWNAPEECVEYLEEE